MKKLLSIILAIMMIAAVGAAFADAGNNYSGATQTTVSRNNIPLTKTIVMINANGSDVYEPNVGYTYTVAPDTSVPLYGSDRNPDTTVTDTNDNVGRVFQGPTGGVTGTTISFSSANTAVTTSATGVEVTKAENLTFVPTATWTRPGIYRYIITESVDGTGTDAEEIAAAGLTARGDAYSNIRYLDVYVKYDTAGTGFEMYGAVIYKALSSDTSAANKSITTSTTGKTTGFEPDSSATGTVDYTSDGSVDRYTTYDIEVKKLVAGTLGDKNNEFPFYVNITNTITGAKYTYTNDAGTATAETIAAAAITKGTDDTTSALALKNNESIKFVGVPSNQSSALSIAVKEYNNTYDAYTATVTVANGTAPTVTVVTNITRNSAATIPTFDIKTNDHASQLMTITNTLTEVSPTGYVTRFAPYALILVAGIALLIVAKKRKPAKDDEE